MSKISPDPDRLGLDPWQIVERAPDAARAALHETLFALGNGRIGVRGAHEEGHAWPGAEQDAIFINGFFEIEDIHHPENAYGLARHNQFIVAVPNGKAMRWWIDDEAFDPAAGSIEDYRRGFDFRTGLLTREFVWVSPRGRRVGVTSRRVVCLDRPQVYALEYELRLLDDAPARLVIESSLDARGRAADISDDPRAGSAHAAQALERTGLARTADGVTLLHRTRRSGLRLASAMRHAALPAGVGHAPCGADDAPGLRIEAQVAAGGALRLEKFCALVSSLDHAGGDLAGPAETAVAQACAVGFAALCVEQRLQLDDYWDDADVEIDGDAALQQGLRFNLLHLLQSVGRDGRTNIAAKGVTGSGYDGHYFWDTEIYVFPVMLHTRPKIARSLLEFRHRTLPAARARARELNHAQGALFPWRTIAGEECSAYFPAGTAQFHINADIAFAIKRYWEVTGDDDFMRTQGAELVFETARIWLDLGHFEPAHPDTAHSGHATQRFVIHTVTGPDEYTALVDNNFYTNAMAQMHLAFAAELVEWLGADDPVALGRVAAAIALATTEPPAWRRAAQCMYLPYDRARGVHPQDDSFLSKPRWEAADIPADKRPLLMHYHSLVIYRHQVCKQADVLLALVLLGERFELADKRRDFDYYEPLTTHDSSLSRCIFGIVAAEVGYADKAYDYFEQGVRADLDDHHGNTHRGVHTAAMAGAWLGVVAGFAGLRMRRGEPAFAPRLPAQWSRCAFKLRIGAAQLRVEMDRDATHYRLLAGDALALQHGDVPVRLSRATPLASFAASMAAPTTASAFA